MCDVLIRCATTLSVESTVVSNNINYYYYCTTYYVSCPLPALKGGYW